MKIFECGPCGKVFKRSKSGRCPYCGSIGFIKIEIDNNFENNQLDLFMSKALMIKNAVYSPKKQVVPL